MTSLKSRPNTGLFGLAGRQLVLAFGVGAVGLGTPLLAAQQLDVRDGVRVKAVISLKDTSRIKVEGQHITEVFGDVRTNGVGRLMVTTDEAKGELFIRPVFGDSQPSPIHIFVATASATYGLLLQVEDLPADTITLVDRGAAGKAIEKSADKPTSSYVRQLKNMMVAMSSDTLVGLQVREINAPVLLWQEVHYTHLRDVTSGNCVGSQYHLREKLGKPIVLHESEFYTAGVAAVAIEQLSLSPYGSTHVFAIKCGVGR